MWPPQSTRVFPVLQLQFLLTNLVGSEDRENFGWVKNSMIDFSLARNNIVVWTIQSRHWAKHICSGWKELVFTICVGTKQITSVYALSGNFFLFSLFLTVSDVAPKPCDV